jgi:hypothetical protein
MTREPEPGIAVEPSDDARKTRRGYATRELAVISPDDERYWSVADAARLLGPPEWTESQVRQLVNLLALQPAGKRQGGSRRRHVRVYEAGVLARAHSALARAAGSL